MLHRLFIPIVACCVVLLCTGCTPRQSKDQYQERLSNAVAVRNDVSNGLTRHQYSSGAEYTQAMKRVVDASDELSSDQPPRGLGDAHEQMVAGMEGLQVLLSRLGRCADLESTSHQDARACRQSISQDVYDEIRNDFEEADTIYRQDGLSLPQDGGDGRSAGAVNRADVLDEPTDTTKG